MQNRIVNTRGERVRQWSNFTDSLVHGIAVCHDSVEDRVGRKLICECELLKN